VINELTQLSISLTDMCPVECDHCLIDCSPKNKGVIDFELVKILLKQTRVELPIESVGLTGGEPFFVYEYLLQIMDYIHHNYNYDVGVISNAYWATDSDESEKKIMELKLLGLKELVISTDQYHQKYIPIENIFNVIKAAKKLGIRTTLRHVYTNDSSTEDWMKNFYTTDLSSEDFQIINSIDDWKIKGKIFVEKQPCFFIGRAKDKIPRSNLPLKKMCEDEREINSACLTALKIIHMYINGDVAFCCGAFKTNRALIQGNLKKDDFGEILKKALYSPIYNSLSTKGFSEIVEFLRSNGHELPEEFSSMCHLCHMIFTNKAYLPDLSIFLKKNALKYFLEHDLYEKKKLEEETV